MSDWSSDVCSSDLWLDGNYWADGLLILAISPRGQWVGCYFGEDIKVDLAVQQNIQDAAKSSFQAGRWDTGIQQIESMYRRHRTSATA